MNRIFSSQFWISLMNRALSLLSVTFCMATPALATNSSLDLTEYFRQVETGYEGYSASRLRQEGSQTVQKNLSSLADTQLFSNIYYNDDRRPTANPSFQGSQTSSTGFSLGLQKQFLSGPKLELAQHFSHTSIVGASPVSIPLADYYDTYPKLSLTVPLWRNFSGTETKASDESLRTEAQAELVGSDLEYSRLHLRIESTFYALAAARENVQVQKEILERANQILHWVNSQYHRHLIDNSDLFQAQAAVTARNMQLLDATTHLAEVEREFNLLRGVSSEQVTETLAIADLPIEKLNVSDSQLKKRKDLILAMISSQARELNQIRQVQVAKPKLDFMAEAQWNGRDSKLSDAQSEVTSKNQTLWFLGLQFSMPLDFSQSQEMKSGLEKLVQSSRLSIKAQESDFKRIWTDFANQGKSLYEQISLIRELEVIQKKKADAERIRLNSGRSTTFQLLSFEQDYSSTKSQRIHLELNARQYLAQSVLFDEPSAN